jgi:hypothetical protein
MLDFFIVLSIMPVWTFAACYRAMQIETGGN